MSDSYDYSFELGKVELVSYFTKAHKDTLSIIAENEGFFQSLKNVNEIYVLGHSLSEIDRLYFVKVIDSVNSKVFWKVSAHTEEDKLSHKGMLEKCGLNRNMIELISISELMRGVFNVQA